MTIKEFNLCVDNNADAVYRFILKNLRDEDRANDVVQEAFSRMWVKVQDISYAKSKSYLFTTAYHYMIDMIRKEKRFIPLQVSHQMYNVEQNSYSDLKEIS